MRISDWSSDVCSSDLPNERGYIVRKGNRTVYPTVDRSVVVRIETADGAVGWGETYGIVAPGAVIALVDDLLGPFVVGRDPLDAAVIHDDLYDLMRVRRSEEHTSELQSLMRISYAVF